MLRGGGGWSKMFAYQGLRDPTNFRVSCFSHPSYYIFGVDMYCSCLFLRCPLDSSGSGKTYETVNILYERWVNLP